MFSFLSLFCFFLVVIKKVTKEKNDTQTNPCGQPVIVLWRRRKCGCGCELTLREDLQPLAEQDKGSVTTCCLSSFFFFLWKKTFFLILFCFFAVVVFYPWLLISEFSGVLVQLRALNKFVERKKNNRGGKKVGRTLFCIFGLKSQLSGKQSSDCLVCLWNIFSFSSVTHTHISVWEHVCVLLSSVAKVAGCPPQPDGVLCEFGAGAAPLQFSCHQLALTALMSLTRFWARQIPKI